MSTAKDLETWTSIKAILEDQLQYGFLEQAKSVVDVRFSGCEVTLIVSSDEALEFFSAEVNQQRLIIVSRPVASIESISVVKVEAEPIE